MSYASRRRMEPEGRRALRLPALAFLAPLIFLDESAQVGLGGAAPRKLQED